MVVSQLVLIAPVMIATALIDTVIATATPIHIATTPTTTPTMTAITILDIALAITND